MLLNLIYETPVLIFLAFIISFFAGFVKGIVGFAMPMILLSGLSAFMHPQHALAALILPTLVTNLQQALTKRPPTITETAVRFRLFLITCGIFMIISTQLTPYLPTQLFLGILGILIFVFSFIQIIGLKLELRKNNQSITFILAAMTGLIGGMSGIWGPLTVIYLTTINLRKEESIKVQGIVYTLGAFLLLFGHIQSGIFTWYTASFSVSLIIPSVLGLLLGARIRNKINQSTFRKATLIVLLIAGGNLVRRAWFN